MVKGKVKMGQRIAERYGLGALSKSASKVMVDDNDEEHYMDALIIRDNSNRGSEYLH